MNRLVALWLILPLLVVILLIHMIVESRGEEPMWLKGHRDFCRIMKHECAPYPKQLERVQMTPERWKQLAKINTEVNQQIVYQDDLVHYLSPEVWTYPIDGKGDCEDIALEKRRRLVLDGWPRSALLMTITNPEPTRMNAELHAVLTVRTTIGNLYLDMSTNAPTKRHGIQGRIIARQSPRYPWRWTFGDIE